MAVDHCLKDVHQLDAGVPRYRYTHAIVDYREVDRAKLLARVRTVHTVVHTTPTKVAV